MQELNWNDLRCVLALARAGNTLNAARGLKVDETTIVRRLARIEQSLDARLFERTRGRFTPTPAGTAVVARAERMEMEVDTLRSQVTGANHAASGLVRMSSVPIIVNRLLVPALPRLLARNPHLQIEAVGDPRDLSLNKREADITVRLAWPRGEPNIIARRVGELRYAAYGLKRRSRRVLPWIAYPDMMAAIEPARWTAERISEARAEPSLFLADTEALLQAVKAGLGKALLPTFIGDAEPRLVRLGDGAESLIREVWLLVHPDLYGLGRITAVTDWIVDVFVSLRPDTNSRRPTTRR